MKLDDSLNSLATKVVLSSAVSSPGVGSILPLPYPGGSSRRLFRMVKGGGGGGGGGMECL